MQNKRKSFTRVTLLICMCMLCLLFILAQNNYKPNVRNIRMSGFDILGRVRGRIEQRTTELSASEEQIRFRIMRVIKQADILKESVDSLFTQKGE